MNIQHLIMRIRAASRQMVREFGFLNDRFSSIGSTSQCHALVELDSHGEMNMGQLSQILGLDKSTTSRLITQLYEREMCDIRSDSDDRRNKIVTLTSKGLDHVNVIHAQAELQVNQALEVMSDEERTIVSNGLFLYAHALKKARLLQEYAIRHLTKDDVSEIAAIIRSVRAEFGFDMMHTASHEYAKELEHMYETYSSEKSAYFVVMHGKTVVGGAGYSPLISNEHTVCELKNMYILAHVRGVGLGVRLIRTILQHAKNAGLTHCYLETHSSMHRANALYKKCGFILLDKPVGNTGHHWTDCWYMKEL